MYPAGRFLKNHKIYTKISPKIDKDATDETIFKTLLSISYEEFYPIGQKTS